ncbi:hypothetical protein C8J57DRAFT_1531913 [Mycena rebaudengoi]|nr:hypothetical protein C8J57DRAFT_1531913 [Mycena rebaudengoi]
MAPHCPVRACAMRSIGELMPASAVMCFGVSSFRLALAAITATRLTCVICSAPAMSDREPTTSDRHSLETLRGRSLPLHAVSTKHFGGFTPADSYFQAPPRLPLCSPFPTIPLSLTDKS